jgi:hypothetical protein
MAIEMTTTTDIGPTGEAIEALKLIRSVDQFYSNPLGFVRTCFPWGEPGTALEHFPRPGRMAVPGAEGDRPAGARARL